MSATKPSRSDEIWDRLVTSLAERELSWLLRSLHDRGLQRKVAEGRALVDYDRPLDELAPHEIRAVRRFFEQTVKTRTRRRPTARPQAPGQGQLAT